MSSLIRFMATTLLALSSLSAHDASAQVLERQGSKLFYCDSPIRLLGYGDYGMLAEPNFDYVAYIDKLVSKKVNFSRIWVIYHFAKGITPFQGTFGNWDLTAWNEDFFLRLKNFVAYAESKGVIVQVNIFDSVHMEGGNPLRWDRSPYNKNNNKQSYCNSGGDADDMDGNPPVWQQVNKPLIGKIVSTLNGFGNVMYEAMNEPNGPYGDQNFVDAVIDELHALLNAPGHTGSKIISLNPRLGTSTGVNNPKVDVVSFHITKSTEAGNFGGFNKPTIVSNDGDPMSQSTQEGYSSAQRIANVKLICNKVFSNEVGKMHVEILDKDINCDTWKTYDYDPSANCLSNGVLDALKGFSETPINTCGAGPVDPGDTDGGPVDPTCPVGQKITVDNGATGSKTTASGTYTETTKNWDYRLGLGQSTGADYRYLSQYIGDKTRKGTAKWQPKLTRKGTYRVTATFRATGNRTKDADYYVYDANGVKSHFQVDQSKGLTGENSFGPVYEDLGTHYLEPGKGYVLLDGDDGKSDEADAAIFTLKSCSEIICTPDCTGKPAGADNLCGGQCPGCVPSCKAKPPGTDNGCGKACDACEVDCAGKNGGADGCGGTCPVCQPACAGKKAGTADGCGGKCPDIPVACPAPPPGPQTVVAYATQANSTGGWTEVSRAEDKADGKFCHTENLDKGENLSGTSFGVCDPDGAEIITSVKVGVRSKAQYDSGKYKIIVKVGASGQSKTFSHDNLAWDDLDITSTKAGWTWNDVKALKVTVSLGSHPGGFRDSDVWVDAYRVTVGFTSCTPKVSKVCAGGNSQWVDGCGATAELAEACDDGNACTNDGCAGGSCTHAVLPTPECIDAPVPVCTPKASKACFGTSTFWVDSCGIASEVAESCNDGDPCTQDGCDAGTLACTHTLLLTPGCGGCTPFASLGCLAGSQVWKDSCGNVDDIAGSCDDGNPCTIDGCDELGGSCTYAPSDAPACKACEPDVALACNATGIYQIDGCGAYGALVQSCDDGDPCTVDGCEPNGLLCTHVPLKDGPACKPCIPDASPTCFGGSLVFADSCGNVTKVVTHCSDGDECTVDTCNPATQACEFVAASSPDCAGGCIPLAKRACVNGHIAWVDSCGNTGALAELCDDDDPCTVDLCNVASAVCTHAPAGSLECAPCVDQGEIACFSGAVVSLDSCKNVVGVVESCQDDDPCTIDACEPATKTCLHTPSGAAGCIKCEPNASTRCEANVLVNVDSCGNTLGLAQSCDDFDACTVDLCNGGTSQCEHYPSPAPECAPCTANETLACVDGELLWFDSCGEPGEIASKCDDGDACTFDDCDPTANLCAHLPTTGPGCDGCGGDTGTGCFLGKRVAFNGCGVITKTLDDCVDGDPCTSDDCNSETGECVNKPTATPECFECKPNTTTACKGNDIVWVDSCNVEGDIVTSCDDGDSCTVDACDSVTAFCVHVPDGSCTSEEPCLDAPIQFCQDGVLFWLDACGQLSGVDDPCTDADPCTTNGCDPETLSCTVTPVDTVDCGGEPPEEDACDKSAFLDCFAGGLVWVNACGEQKGIAKLCDDGDPCTQDGCDPALVSCVYSPSASADCDPPEPADDPPGSDDLGANDDLGGSDDLGGDGASDSDDLGGPVNGAELETSADTGATTLVVSGGNDGCTTGGRGTNGLWVALLGLIGLGWRRRSLRLVTSVQGGRRS